MKLTEATEEVATFYGKMLDHDYTTKEAFRKVMTEKEKDVVRYGVLTFLHFYIWNHRRSIKMFKCGTMLKINICLRV